MSETITTKKETSQKKTKKKRLRGFPGVVINLLAPLNNDPEFKKKYKNDKFKVLLDTNDGKLAALITVESGVVDVDQVKNMPKENIAKKKLGWKGKLETSTPLFLEIAMGNLSLFGIVIKFLTRKIKMRGIRTLLKLLKIFGMLPELTG